MKYYNLPRKLYKGELCPEGKEMKRIELLSFFGVGFAIITTSIFFLLSSWNVLVLENPFDYLAFSTGVSAIWATVSLAILGKYKIDANKDKTNS